MENYRCIDCGTIYKDEELESNMLFCPSCGSRLEEESFQNNKNQKSSESAYEHQNEDQQKKAKDSRQEQDYIMFNCLSCSKSLRIAFPFKSLSFRCANCSGMYEIHSVDNHRPIYLIVPKVTHRTSDAPPRQRAMPEEVKKALHIFELNVSVSFGEVKAKYRQCMTEYHPDKVAHLGADLRKLAEAKSKEYNAAYSIIQRYFKEINEHN